MRGHHSVTLFDRWAPSYDDSALQPAYEAAHAAVLCWAAQLGARPRRILDVGCGTGRLLDRAAGVFPGAALIGADPSAGMLAAATPDGKFLVRAAAERLPFPDASFDLVTSTWTVRHWADQHAGVRELGRVATPGGLVGFADVLPVPRHRPLVPRRRIPSWLTEAMQAAGLRVLGIRTFGGFGVITELTVVMTRRRGAGREASRPAPGWAIATG